VVAALAISSPTRTSPEPSIPLAPNYTPFGTITGGLAVIQKIAAGGSDNSNGQGDGKPNVPVQITNVTVATS